LVLFREITNLKIKILGVTCLHFVLQDTVTGFFFVGNVDLRRKTNYLIIDNSNSYPLIKIFRMWLFVIAILACW
jgi:hypothetical protein